MKSCEESEGVASAAASLLEGAYLEALFGGVVPFVAAQARSTEQQSALAQLKALLEEDRSLA